MKSRFATNVSENATRRARPCIRLLCSRSGSARYVIPDFPRWKTVNISVAASVTTCSAVKSLITFTTCTGQENISENAKKTPRRNKTVGLSDVENMREQYHLAKDEGRFEDAEEILDFLRGADDDKR